VSSPTGAGAPAPFEELPLAEIERGIGASVEARVRRDPDRVAVRARGRSTRFGELDALANRVARGIVAAGGRVAEPVAVLLGKDERLVAAALGAFKAGSIYVPLDPAYPAARAAAMLDDCGARLIVSSRELAGRVEPLRAPGRRVLDVDELVASAASGPPGVAIDPRAPATILYTSGSTGQPKGVVQNHRGTLHYARNYRHSLRVTADDRISLVSPAGAVGGIRDMVGALTAGATLLPFSLPDEGFAALADWIEREQVTILNVVVTVFRHFAAGVAPGRRFPSLRVVRLGSETIAPSDAAAFQRLCAPSAIMYAGLGITEAGGVTQSLLSARDIVAGVTIDAGLPLENVEVVIADEAGAPVAPGTVGEILVKSRYLALGYWNQPDLTAQAFLVDPAGTDARLYRTGDLGRIRADGRLEHLGRRDAQVKIRGNRVEVLEVELALQGLPGVGQAAVVVRERAPGDPQLVAYVVPAPPGGPETAELRRALRERLPAHMVPAAFVRPAALPATPTGKVDRRALPDPDWSALDPERTVTAGRTPVEAEIAGLWAAVLGVNRVGIDEAFLDLGGDSLRAARLAAMVADHFQLAVPLAELLRASTVAEMALAVTEALAASLDAGEMDRLLDGGTGSTGGPER
jgi:amino acid adenylation domain-containing protein